MRRILRIFLYFPYYVLSILVVAGFFFTLFKVMFGSTDPNLGTAVGTYLLLFPIFMGVFILRWLIRRLSR